eukprot:GEMP01063520.1.p1 GENE.GEMP01063520.1~~GEMP01063520.1.p1  ORF type:complete len:246 (+),score=58.57 GEMP01063520.1:294-1031(+)
MNDDGPVALLKRFVVDACTDADSTTEWRVFLGLSTVSDGTVGISSATFDFPWLTLLLNRWVRVLCHASSDERQDASIFSSWELLFPAAADKEAHSTVTVDPAVLRLPPPDIMLLARLGFAIPQPGDEKLKSLLMEEKKKKGPVEEPATPARVRSRSFIASKKRRLVARPGSPTRSGGASLLASRPTSGNPWKRRMLEREKQTVMLLQREQHSSTQQSQRQLRIQKYAEQRRKFIQLRPKPKADKS